MSSHDVGRTRSGRLAEVADDREAAGGAAPGEHPPLHRREVLGLVDEHVRRTCGARPAHRRRRRAVAVARGDVGRAHERSRTSEVVDAHAGRPASASSSAVRRRRLRGSAASTGPSSASASSTSATSASVQRAAGDVGEPGAVEQILFRVVEQGCTDDAGGRSHERTEAEQIVHELRARQHRPHAFERLDHLGPATQARASSVLEAFGQRVAARDRAPDRASRPSRAARSRPRCRRRGRFGSSRRRRSYARVRRELVRRHEDVGGAAHHVGPALVVRALLALRASHDASAVLACEPDARARRA